MSDIYAVDFDGTLCTNLYPKIGAAKEEAIKYFKEKRDNGDILILWTCRTGKLLEKAIEWCKDQGLEFDAINENLKKIIKKFGSDCRKIYADFYVDDKNFDMAFFEKRGKAMPLMKSREYRAILQPFQIPQNEKRIDSDFYVEGFATTFDKPYELYEWEGIKYYEVIDRHALDEADMSDVIFQFDHGGKVFARNSNKTLGLEPIEKGLFIFADLSKSPAAKEMYVEIDSGLVTKMSWAFVVGEDKYDRDTRTRTITKIKKVYDVSAVSIPANSDTDISARSFFNGEIEKEKQELLERRKKILKLKIDLEV